VFSQHGKEEVVFCSVFAPVDAVQYSLDDVDAISIAGANVHVGYFPFALR
jgi:hypothetical protein